MTNFAAVTAITKSFFKYGRINVSIENLDQGQKSKSAGCYAGC
jgi:hypothetical protein